MYDIDAAFSLCRYDNRCFFNSGIKTDGIYRRSVWLLMQKPRTLKEEINETTSRKKPRVFRREIRTAQEILAMTGRESHFP